MRRVIGIDVHRTFGEVVFREDGRLRHAGRIDITRTALEGFGKTLLASDEVVLEATGNSMTDSRGAPFAELHHHWGVRHAKLMIACGGKSHPAKAEAGKPGPSLAGVVVTRGPKCRQEPCGVRE
ncbi:hypothetical protein [Bradyrhizobium sp. SEMIA]|uniref:hypothetical protein n=1 Tax=Bradyrhizobium sp. SEMIA TaxID=2597515 RepID=UPI00224077CB|nr:hypothetical protein [Bradyrhizobium sp. SEMIA]